MTAGKSILYIEDNFDNRMLVRRLLEHEGFLVLEAENAHQALELLQTRIPDLILMDINMPEIDGYTLTRQIKTAPQTSHVPVIALTANVMRGDKERTLRAGCDGYIEKPIDIDTFIDQVNQFLNGNRVKQL
ncbi:FOG: CheY-like receiver [Bellilinea caldifistulae]|uniref:Chemotaxis protein CheY n=1 Tax=Bellilinea caldifistulae TaxID=360411 RepID=A0A0P6XG47_9CHLR|nr:response regulator [Bellilinea caldifistulae]KPL73811.1 chemotaxis protein CheY [Bellilinea caldifistulae]GAP11082.1 FOG: CheY-like receiver [Bellilinea caldifistulae]